MSDSARPWICPERRCTPLLNLRDGDYKDITVPEPGQSFTCFGKMAEPVTFVYDGVEHTNDCNGCHYTPLKGLIRWQENAGDWETLSTYYGLAAKKARAADAERWQRIIDVAARLGVTVRGLSLVVEGYCTHCRRYDLVLNLDTETVDCSHCGATELEVAS